MPLITFDLPSTHILRLIDAFCGLHDYDHFAEEGESRGDFALRIVRGHLVGQVRRWEQKEANAIALASLTDIDVT